MIQTVVPIAVCMPFKWQNSIIGEWFKLLFWGGKEPLSGIGPLHFQPKYYKKHADELIWFVVETTILLTPYGVLELCEH